MNKLANGSKQYIMVALLNLMEQKDFDDISISEIVKKAGVGRATFYRNFNSKEDVINYYFLNATNEFTEIKPRPSCGDDDYYKLTLGIIKFLKDNTEMLNVIIKSHLEILLLNHINEQMVKFFDCENKSTNPILPYAYAGCVYNVSIEWVRSGCVESIESVAEALFIAVLGKERYNNLTCITNHGELTI